MQLFSHRLLGPAILALIGLVSAPAYAQILTLNSGDVLTVSGAGTVGTLGGTTYLPGQNTTSSYIGSDDFGSYAVETNDTSAFALGTGGTLTGGLYGIGLLDHGSGSVTISGGTLQGDYGLLSDGSGSVTISGGTFSGGEYGDGLGYFGIGPVTVTGGTFVAGLLGDALEASGSRLVTVSGGTFTGGQNGDGLYADGGSVAVTGGTFSGGQDGVGLSTFNGGMMNLFSKPGTQFSVDGQIVSNGPLGLYPSGTDTISGILLNGDVLNTTFFNIGTLNLNVGTPPVPEASTTVSFGLLLALGLGGMAFAARKRGKA